MKGFTMIELIFVIVILGVLAAVAIPKLAATRDDAEVVRAAQNISTSLTDLMGYYMAKGKYNSDVSNMTNVANPIKVKQDVCATYEYNNETQMTLKKSYGGLCKAVWNVSSLKTINTIYSSDALLIVQ
jgi:prokaryotic N-methylation motif domain protein